MTNTTHNVLPLRPRDHENVTQHVIDWLEDRHRKGLRKAFEDLLEKWRPEGAEDNGQMDEDAMSMLAMNAGEWLIARGQIHARGGLREINAYLLGSDGPYLTPGQKAWIGQMRERELRLYRVTDVQPDIGLTLVDELDAQAPPQTVRERSGSRTAQPGMLMGARIMQPGEGAEAHHELSGAIFLFAELREAQALARVRGVLDGAGALKMHAQNLRDLAETEIARAWMAQWFEPTPMPQIRDATTGEPMLLVTDHYRVRDAAALAAALAAQADVSGDAQHSWHRDQQGEDGQMRSLAAINPGRRADRIEVFYRTQRLADEGRVWFEALAGSAVKHMTRELADPTGGLVQAEKIGKVGKAKARKGAGSDATGGLPPEALAQAIEQFIHSHYANWCDETIPALGGRTPRQAISTAAGLERVKGLLREYEEGERQQCKAQGRPAVSYQFLWDALGMSR